MKNPCKDCENRSVTCHSECEQYLLYRNENLERNDKKLLHAQVKAYTKELIDKRAKRVKKWRS